MGFLGRNEAWRGAIMIGTSDSSSSPKSIMEIGVDGPNFLGEA